LLDKELQQLLAPIVTALGYELVGVVRLSQGGHNALLRVYIDHPDGISLDDCERVSYQVSGLLDVQDPIRGHYTLEVSSPGLDRPLFTLDHFIRFVGHKVRVHLTRPLGARRNFTGMLQRVQDRNVIVVADGTEYSLPYDQINKAHIVPD
jgi:ribosome maturation factor RimP